MSGSTKHEKFTHCNHKYLLCSLIKSTAASPSTPSLVIAATPTLLVAPPANPWACPPTPVRPAPSRPILGISVRGVMAVIELRRRWGVGSVRGNECADLLLSVFFRNFDDERFARVRNSVAVHLPDRFFGFLAAIEADEGGSADLSGPFVAEQFEVDDFAETRKQIAD